MKIRNTFLAAISAVAMGGTLATPVAAKELRLSTPTPEPHIMTKSAHHMAEAFAASGATDTIAVFPGNKLGDVPTVLSLLQSGAVEMAIVPVGDLANREPAFLGWFLPYQFDSLAAAGAAANSAPAREMLAKLDAQGIKGLGYVFPGQRHVLSKAPISTIDDFAGLKIRAFPNDIFNAWWRQVGAAPTALPLPEIMPSLVTGVIDAVDVDLDIVMGLQMYQQAPHLVLTNHMAFPAAILASQRWWDGLTPQEQEALTAIVAETQGWALETQTASEDTLLKVLAEKGAIVSRMDPAPLAAAGAEVSAAFVDRDPLIRAFHDANQ
ncbi:TRAP transporter substrate-binding protein [Phaeovulum sp. W22_SRMD_FR3]|uniref:TRAP transporter substrate-binding protein n=1 Tax=Phaeovulum sp. W22_SRMD_FR3 TaxID=3240274 RepID=UPI003F9E5BFF